jgi:hypothetical protein
VTRPSDLPPGCSASSIPGNRPGDDDDERFADLLATRADRDGIPEHRIDDALNGDVWRLLLIALEIGREWGFAEGRAEGEIDAAARFEPVEEPSPCLCDGYYRHVEGYRIIATNPACPRHRPNG